ncbi:MAG TPA: hypothetical protein VHZ97_01635 [Pseudonocardiaceae bacterium]|jgi:hypothetical protein|nr:hypothetical protein [Pseudonocardiaceae bacterium]
MGRRRAFLSALAVLTAALILAGCANSFPSMVAPKLSLPPTSTSAVATDCLTADNVISACTRLGELSTLDPCGLLTLSEFPPDLDASPKPRESLDYCVFGITAGSDKDAEVELGTLDSVSDSVAQNPGRYDLAGEVLQPAGLELEKSSLQQGECDDALQFEGDLVNLEINVFTLSGGAGSQSLCDAANEVGEALAKVMGGKTQMQHFTVPKDSIAKLKACSLLDGSNIGGNAVEGQSDTPSGHSCQWTPDPTNYDLQIGIDLEIGSKLESAAAASTSQIHGLQTFTIKYSPSDFSRCEVDTDRAPWGSAGNGLVEIVSMWVDEPAGQADTACSLATQMANIVWPKLPAIS